MAAKLTIDVLSLFPDMVEAPLGGSILGKAVTGDCWRYAAIISVTGRRTSTAKRTITFAEGGRACC